MSPKRQQKQPDRIVCTGRDVDEAGNSIGRPCGASYQPRDPADHLLAVPAETQARTAGWRIGRRTDGSLDAMCPACGRPDPTTVKLTRDLRGSIRHGS